MMSRTQPETPLSDSRRRELHQLFLDDVPFLDVRAEGEFAKGSFPGAVNLPILNDAEREQVGRCYKQRGSDEAVTLGHQLVCGELKEQRIAAWCQFARNNTDAHLFCWRGGMRSNLSRQWMAQAGVDIPLVEGGYKVLRNLLLDEIDAASAAPMIVIGGRTGSAKTPLIGALSSGIDLEGFANHRGSSFGRRVTPPPSQVNFENALAIDLLKRRQALPEHCLFFEDESPRIGAVSLPVPLFEAMRKAPLAVLEMPLAFRVQQVLKEYVVEMRAEFEQCYGSELGFENYRQYLCESLQRISKRLGLERYRELQGVMDSALQQQLHGSVQGHEAWIETLLRDYYDPMYSYQLSKNEQRVVFRGDYQTLLAWAREQQQTSLEVLTSGL